MRQQPTEKWTEQDAAAEVVSYLTGMGLDVYQEVPMEGVVADIVALRGPEVWIVEVKTTWSLDLLEQLREHLRRCHGHRLFAAVPFSRNDRGRQRLFKDCGFGSITICRPKDEMDWGSRTGVEVMAPRTTSKPLPHITGLLCEGHKTHAKAGAPCAKGRYTPFRQTCDALARVVKQQPGITMKAAIASIEHHYSSDACARASMAQWIHARKVPGVVAKPGKPLKLYPEGYQEPEPPASEAPPWGPASLQVAP